MLAAGMTIQKLLAGMKKHSASDLHIKVGIPPFYRISGILRHIGEDPLDADEADHLLDPIIPEALKPRFVERGDLDFATHNAEGDRFRVNMFRAGGHVNAAIRRIKADIPDYSDLHLPPVYGELISRTNEGLVLVVGVTGSGKSSTLAAMVNQINHTEACNIITVEDPVEYQFKPDKSIISQRELGVDVTDYKAAMRFVVRQDPDVILVGELRDHDTVLAAIQAAETGHLVFSTLHTADTMQAFGRMLEVFPREEHAFIRSSLAVSLRAILAQRLLPAVEGFEVGVVPATEILLSTPSVAECIRNAEDSSLPSIVNASIHEGMMSFTKSLSELVKKDWVAIRTAMAFAPNRDALMSEIKGLEVKSSTLVNRVKGGGG